MELERARSNILKIPEKPGVYFLFDGEELVYIGKTTKGIKRIFQHEDKKFNGYYFFDCELDKISKLESDLIKKYKPQYNLLIPGQKCKRKDIKKVKYDRIELVPQKLGSIEDIDLKTYMEKKIILSSKDLKQLVVLQWMEYNSLTQSKAIIFEDEIYFYLDYDLIIDELPFVHPPYRSKFSRLVKSLKENNFIKTLIYNNSTYFHIPDEYRVLDKNIEKIRITGEK